MTLTILEFADNARASTGEKMAGEIEGPLATDALGLPIKVITPTVGVANDIQLSSRTRAIKLITDSSTRIRYRVRPRTERNMPVNAPSATLQTPSANHPSVAISSYVLEAVYSGAVISIAGY